jgi:hypothetical protein
MYKDDFFVLRDGEGYLFKARGKQVNVMVAHFNPLAIDGVGPVHVRDNVSWHSYLLNSHHPLINIRDYR